MSPIARIVHDIKNGVNLDLYVTMVLAFVLAGVNLASDVLEWNLPFDLAPLNLSVLFVVAIVLMGNRRKLDAIESRIHNIGVDGIIETFPDSYVENIMYANDVLQVGMHLSSNLNEYHDAYRCLLKRKKKLRILIADPDGNAFDMAAMRFPGGIDPSQERTRARSSLQSLEALFNEFPKYLEVCVLDYLFEYAALLVNEHGSNSVIFVERYTFRTRGGAKKPKSVFTRDDKDWYSLYTHEITELWKEGRWVFPAQSEAVK